MTEILWSRPLYPNDSCQLLPEAHSLSTGYPLRRSKPAQERCQRVTDRLDMTIAVDWAVKPHTNKQTFLSNTYRVTMFYYDIVSFEYLLLLVDMFK